MGEKNHIPGQLIPGGITRRVALRLGSLAGLACFAGCSDPARVAEAGPLNPWPEPIKGPVLPRSDRPIVTVPTQAPTLPAPPQQPNPAPVLEAVTILPRTRWTTADIRRPGNALRMTGVSRITVHHDALIMTDDREGASMNRLVSIQNAHLQRRSKRGEAWADIGYHYIVDRAGRVWEGRPVRYQGAHVEDNNEYNIGVMCMGNFMQQAPVPAQTRALDLLLGQLMKQHRVGLGRVYTHQELDSTQCPGLNLQRYMVSTRSRGGMLAMLAGPHLA